MSHRQEALYAACREYPALPWTETPGTYPDVVEDMMVDVCHACPARGLCVTAVAQGKAVGGIWGGLPGVDLAPGEPARIWVGGSRGYATVNDLTLLPQHPSVA